MSRSVLIALAGLVVLAIAIGLSFWGTHREDATPPVASAPGQTAPVTPTAPNNQPSPVPSFDIVRIDPDGHTVIAGRGMPKAEITILDGTKELGKVIADNHGEWVFVPDQPLPPGARELSLRASNPDGTTRTSEAPVILVVPDKKGASLAVRVNPNGSIDVLQGPESAQGAGPVSVDAVKFDDQGHLSVVGKATPKASVRTYLDNDPIGTVASDEQGRWGLTVTRHLKDGSHTIRADQMGADGKVTARVEISFTSGAGAKMAEGQITIAPGNNLWRIARATYGRGLEYLTIYQANKEQIRDPNLIYPGQVFVLPKTK